MARGKYGAGRATGGDDYDLIDIGYVPSSDTGSSISSFVEPDEDEGAPSRTSSDDSGSSSGRTYSSSVPRWRRALADAISPPPPGSRPARSTGSTGSTGFASRTSATRSTSAARPGRPARPTSQVVYGLDNRERIISAVAAGLAIAFAIVVGIVGSHAPKTSKTQPINSLELMAIFGVPALAMLLGVIVKRRALVGFAALFTGFALFAFGVFYAVIYFALGGWLVFRALKYNKQVALEKQEKQERQGSRAGSESGRSSSKAAPDPAARSSRRTADVDLDDEDEAPRRRWWSGLDKEAEPVHKSVRPSRREAATASKARAAATSKRYTPPRPASSQRRGT